MSRLYSVIENNRNALDTAPLAPSLEQLTTLRDCLALVYSLDDTAALMGICTSRVIDEVSTLGKWLIHTNGGIEVSTETLGEMSQMVLFQEAQHKRGPATLGKGSKGKAAKNSGQKLSKRKVVLPQGFEPGRNGRDVSRALSAIVVFNPDATTLARYIARTYPPVRQSTLTFSILTSVWKFAALGRLNEIDQVNPSDRSFMNLVISAFDLLDTAISRAHEGVAELLSYAKVEGWALDLDAIHLAANKARLLNEAEITRIDSRIELARSSKTPAALVTEIRFFERRVEATPSLYKIEDIAHLNQAQVRRIAQAAGIEVEGSDRAGENDIRARLRSIGIETDLDRLVLAGIQASQSGKLESFFEVMTIRASGDDSWVSQLSDIFSVTR